MNIKKNFPLLMMREREPFIYLDNAATMHKPQSVIKAITDFYAKDYATVGRSMYALAEEATQKVEDARKKVAQFMNADTNEVIFTKGATESINILAERWALAHLKAGDEILLTQQEHHANLLPWLEVAKKTGAVIRYIPILHDGALNLTHLDQLITKKTKLVSLATTSNALGLKNDISTIRKQSDKVGAKLLLDLSQSVAHEKTDLKKLGADFAVFSGHKLLGPTGIGILFINQEFHDAIEPYQFGGGMVYEADYDRASYHKAPHKFEAGTPPIAQIIGLGAAIDYFNHSITFKELQQHEAVLMTKLIDGLAAIHSITILGSKEALKKGSIVSFTVKGYHPHDVAAYLDQQGIAVRAGHYCAQPLAKKLGIDGSIRVSIFGYNSLDDIDSLLKALSKLTL